MIQEALLRSILSSQQLEEAILSYNQIYAQRWNFAALHHFFSEVLPTVHHTWVMLFKNFDYKRIFDAGHRLGRDNNVL